MMETSVESDVKLLRRMVERVYGSKVVYARDCSGLSQAIFDKTGLKVSETTIKRFWELVASSFNPSKYTLNSLAVYVGFADYDDFLANKDCNDASEELIKKWNSLKASAMAISQSSFASVSSRMGIPFKNVIRRQFAEKRLENFLSSDKCATAFIAPGGYGKSTIMAALTYDFFLCENPRHPNDIVWFMDCGVIDRVMAKGGMDVETFLLKMLGLDGGLGIRNFCESLPEEAPGRFVIILDGLNEAGRYGANLNVFIQNILHLVEINGGQKRFKLVLTLRPDLWNYICRSLVSSDELKRFWFDVEFSTISQSVANIPPLKMEEVEKILMVNNVYSLPMMASLMQEGLTNITRIPYFLFLYISLSKVSHEIVSDTDLLREFVERKISGSENGERKLKLIDYLLFATNYGLEGDSVDKSLVDNFLNDYKAELDELLSYGIVYEYKNDDKFLHSTTYIRFSHQILFDFLLSNYWLREFGFTENLFEELANFYNTNHSLKFQIAIWLIKYAFREKKRDVIKNIFNVVSKYFVASPSNLEDVNCMSKLINIVGLEIRRYAVGRDEILHAYASNQIGRESYFINFCDIDSLNSFYGEALDYFLGKVKNQEYVVFGNVVKLQQNFFNNDKKGVANYFAQIQSIDLQVSSPQIYNQILASQLLYYYLVEDGIPQNVVDVVLDYATSQKVGRKTSLSEFGYLDIILADCLFLCEKWNEVKIICEQVVSHVASSKLQFNEYYRQLFLMYAYSLLCLGYKKKANMMFAKISTDYYELMPINASNYWTMRYCIIAAAFNEDNSELCSDFLRKGLAISKFLQFSFFQKKIQSTLRKLKIRFVNK